MRDKTSKATEAKPEAELYPLHFELLESLDAIGAEVARLNDNLESGRISIRTHHPLCTVPHDANFSILDLEAMQKFLRGAIDSGALVLPSKSGGGA